MAAIEVGDVIQVSWVGDCFGQRVMMVRHYVCDVAADPLTTTVLGNLNALLGELGIGGGEDITTDYLACLPPSYSLTYVQAQRINPERSAWVRDASDAGPGTHNDDTERSNVSCCITMQSDRGGRDQHSNVLLGPSPVTAAVNGEVSVAYKALMTALAEDLKLPTTPVAVGNGSYTPVIYHPDNGLVDFITHYTVQDTSRVVRRRTVRLGI